MCLLAFVNLLVATCQLCKRLPPIQYNALLIHDLHICVALPHCFKNSAAGLVKRRKLLKNIRGLAQQSLQVKQNSQLSNQQNELITTTRSSLNEEFCNLHLSARHSSHAPSCSPTTKHEQKIITKFSQTLSQPPHRLLTSIHTPFSQNLHFLSSL